MKVIEHRHLFRESLMDCCIEFGWYTNGDASEYQNLLSKPYDSFGGMNEITPELLYDIAKDIKEHSDDVCPSIEDIMYTIHKKEVGYYEVVQE